MNARLIASTKLDHTLIRLLKTDSGYLITSRQRPQSETARPVPFLMPLSAEWKCRTESVAKASFEVIVVMEQISGLLFKEHDRSAFDQLMAELEKKESAAKMLMQQTGDRIEVAPNRSIPMD